MDVKFGIYEESGVQEYWLVEPEEKTVLVYTLQNGQYMGLPSVILGQMVNSPLFPQLKIEVDEVFDRTDFFLECFLSFKPLSLYPFQKADVRCAAHSLIGW